MLHLRKRFVTLKKRLGFASLGAAVALAGVGVYLTGRIDAKTAATLYPLFQNFWVVGDGFFKQRMAEGRRRGKPKDEEPTGRPN